MAHIELKDHDPVNHPEHYTHGDIECIDAIRAAVHDLAGVEAFCTANAIKYLWRWKHKNGVQDLEKAIWYIERLIWIENLPCSELITGEREDTND